MKCNDSLTHDIYPDTGGLCLYDQYVSPVSLNRQLLTPWSGFPRAMNVIRKRARRYFGHVIRIVSARKTEKR